MQCYCSLRQSTLLSCCRISCTSLLQCERCRCTRPLCSIQRRRASCRRTCQRFAGCRSLDRRTTTSPCACCTSDPSSPRRWCNLLEDTSPNAPCLKHDPRACALVVQPSTERRLPPSVLQRSRSLCSGSHPPSTSFSSSSSSSLPVRFLLPQQL